MILYFSGTGNSEYVAKRIGRNLNDDVIDLSDKIRRHDYTELSSPTAWVVVTPTYAWRIPRIVQDWLENTKLIGNQQIYFAMTCGGNIGNAGKYLKRLCKVKKLSYMGCMEIVMPENYIALFLAPAREQALEIIHTAEGVIDETALMIRNNVPLPWPAKTLTDKMNSSIVNSVFYPMFVHAKKFYATDACTSCGKCVNVCPLSNIYLKNQRPVWGDHCTHCMACICRCPSEAIEYGKHSKGKIRYNCPKNS